MARAFISGTFAGSTLALLAAGAVSVISPLPQTPFVASVSPAQAEDTIETPATAGQTPSLPEREPIKSVAAPVATPQSDPAPSVIETTPPQSKRPDVTLADIEQPKATDVPSGAFDVSTIEIAPNALQGSGVLRALEQESPPSLDLEQSDPKPPSDVAQIDVVQSGAPATKDRADLTVALQEPVKPDLYSPKVLQRPSTISSADNERLAALTREPAARPRSPVRSDATPLPQATPSDATAAQTEAVDTTEPNAPEADTQLNPDADVGTDTTTATTTTARDRPSIGTPGTTLVDRADQSANLPRVITPRPAITLTDSATSATALADDSALMSNKVAFENVSDRPLMSIVLLDEGGLKEGAPIGVAALGTFPYPLTVAVDATLADAAERTAQYKAEGLEVMARVNLPANLTGADTEVALSAALDAVPGAVAVMEGPKSGLQGNRALSDQVSSILKGSGHGVVWQPNGLDTAQKLAAKEGVASQTLFRDFDSKDQSPTVIRRFLDQAAFKAGQTGAVIMVGRMRADTISALLVWGLQNRVQRVSVAPVSAVLLDGLGG